MKQIITLLIAIFITNSVVGQIAKKMNQDSETTPADRFSVIHKKAIKEGVNRSATANFNAATSNRSVFTDNKTLDSITVQEWDSNTNQWEPGIREQFTYNTDDRVDEAILSIWDSNTSNWWIFQKDEFTFDTNGNLTLHLIYYQFVPGSWVLSEKREYTFDSNDNLTLEEQFAWNNGVWVNTYKYELTYDMNQNLTLDIGYEWLSNQWTNSYKDEYFYTGNVLSSEVNSLWNYGSSNWDLDTQTFYTFSAGNLILEVVQKYDTNTNLWSILNKTESTYTTSNNLELQILSTWDDNTNDYVFKYKDVYQFDVNGNRTIGIYSEWLGNPAAWVEDYKDEFVYDLNYNLTDIIYPFFYVTTLDYEHAAANNMVIGYLGFEKNNLVWEDSDKWLFFYSNYSNPLNISDYALANAIQVYPNPTSNFLVLSSEIPLDHVEIFSLLGTKVKDVQSGFNAIPMHDIADGIYIVKITAGTHSISKRIIKQ